MNKLSLTAITLLLLLSVFITGCINKQEPKPSDVGDAKEETIQESPSDAQSLSEVEALQELNEISELSELEELYLLAELEELEELEELLELEALIEELEASGALE
jgi:hypothetical protein